MSILRFLFSVLFLGFFMLLVQAQAQEDSGTPSNYLLGIQAYQQGEFRRAFDAWSLGAYEGNAEAQYNMGVLYLEGKGVEQNIEQARAWFLEAAKQQHAEALYNLGHMSLSGLGVEKDVPAALSWWKRASEGGYAQAQFNYGRALYLGIEGHEDKSAGLALIRRAAEQKDNRAQAFLTENVEEIAQIEGTVSGESVESPITTLDDPEREVVSVERNLPASQPSEVKLEIIRDTRPVQQDYFMRSIDRSVTIYTDADFSTAVGQLLPGTLLKVISIEESRIEVVPASELTDLDAGWISGRDLAYSGETAQQLRDAWHAQKEVVDKLDTEPDTMHEAANSDPLEQPIPTLGAKFSAAELDNNAWLFTQQPDAHVIHLFTLLDFDKALSISQEPLFHGLTHLYTTRAKQQPWMFLLLGPYANETAAKNARAALSEYYARHARIRLVSVIAQNRCAKRNQLDVRQAQGLDAYCF